MNINAKDARQPGCSAEKRGRFIPCRGGGTATTYYTDWHDVDDDAITTSFQGGMRIDTISVGIVYRFMIYNYTPDLVASRLIYLS